MHRVTENVYAEDNYLVATVGFLATREGVVLVDTPMCPTDAREWRSRAEAHGPIRYVINTEHHRDHIIGNAFFPGTVIAQAGTAERFMRSIVSPASVRGFLEKLDPQGAEALANYVPRPPAIVFDNRLVLHLGAHTLDLRHAPGHVPNGTWVYVPQERTVFTGDNIINGAPPFFHSAVPSGWLETLDALARLDLQSIVPGHGAPCGPEAIGRVKAAVTGVIDEVRRGWEAGWSREEAQDRIRYIDRFTYPAPMRERYHHLERLGVGRVHDWLAGHI
jgi:glyoxylase-like metal-dependent hydrolase (beta-lactamase superfamily II)